MFIYFSQFLSFIYFYHLCYLYFLKNVFFQCVVSILFHKIETVKFHIKVTYICDLLLPLIASLHMLVL